MSLYEEMRPWLDEETGLYKAGDFGRDNLILMTMYLMREMGRLREYDDNGLCRRVWHFMNGCYVTPGLYKRRPDDSDDNSVDNLIAACRLGYAHEIRERWNSYFACFDVNNPDKFALNKNFYGRFIGLKAFIVACCGLKPWLIQRMIWCLAVVWSVHTSKGASDPLLMSLQCDRMEKYCPRTVKYWRSHYSPKVLYADFFGKDHPMTKYAADSF